ncbi:MAG: hypothetical protein AAFN42_16575 [Cyanobacteria bacterium J06554_1]
MRQFLPCVLASLCLMTAGACPVTPLDGTQMTLQAQSTDAAAEITSAILTETQQVLERRAQRMGLTQVSVAIVGSNQLQVQLAGDVDVEQVSRVLTTTAHLSFQTQMPGTEADLTALRFHQMELLSSNPDSTLLEENRGAIEALFEPSGLTGAQVEGAVAQPNAYGSATVQVDFDDLGAEQFTEITRQLAGTGQSLGIFLDGQLLSSPTVDLAYAETGITGGSAVISGILSLEAAQELAIQLQSQALPVAVEMIAVETVMLTPECD